MNVEKLSMCRICLVENVRMYVVANKNLQELYEKLTDAPFVTEDRRPMLTCYFCCTKLKKCWRLQQKCLEAEKLFAQKLEEDYETKSQLYQDELEFSGYTISPTEHLSIFDECQTVNDAIKEEIPDWCEGQAVENQTESKQEFQDNEIINMQPYHTESEDIPAQHCKIEDEAHLMDIKIEVKEEQEEIATQHSDSEDNVPLIKLYTGVKQLVLKTKRKANKTLRATAAKEPKEDKRKIKLEDFITEDQKKNEKSYMKIIQTTENHMRKVTFKEPYKCNVCQRSFNYKSRLVVHIRTHTGEKPYKCDICQHLFRQKITLQDHIRTHTGENPYKCDVCRRCFRTKYGLRYHIRAHTGETPYKCDICQRCFSKKSHVLSHIRTHTGEKPYKCDMCPLSFSIKSCLSYHNIRAHTGEKPFKCDICQRCFMKKSDVLRHIRTHTGEKPYKCNICQHFFTRKKTLQDHIRTHTGEKPNKCDICRRCFSTKNGLQMHIRTHSGEKPYTCDTCQRSFSMKGNLLKHIRRHTGFEAVKV